MTTVQGGLGAVYDAAGDTGIRLDPGANRNPACMIKFSAAGAYEWHVTVDGPSVDFGMAVASVGAAVYMAGYTTGTGIINDTTGVSAVTLPAFTSSGVFLVAFDAVGVAQWSAGLDGPGQQNRASVAATASTVYLAGQYANAAVVFQRDTTVTNITLHSTGGTDYAAFLCAFSAAGDALWGATLGQDGASSYGWGVSATNSEVFLAGQYQGAAAVIRDAGGVVSAIAPRTSGGSTVLAGFVVKFSPAGVAQWVATVGNAHKCSYYACAADGAGGVYVSGAYYADGVLYDAAAAASATLLVTPDAGLTNGLVCARAYARAHAPTQRLARARARRWCTTTRRARR